MLECQVNFNIFGCFIRHISTNSREFNSSFILDLQLLCVCVCVNCHVCVLCRVQNSIQISAYYYWMATVIWSILLMFDILIPPFSMVWINILCFILTIFPSHINVLILCSISLNIWSWGFGRTVNGDINLGMANVLRL